MIRTILLAIDGSASSIRAEEFAESLAIQYHAQVIVAHAYNPIPTNLGEPYLSHMQNKEIEAAQSLVLGAAKRLQAAGVGKVDTNFMEGSPAEVILRLANSRKPDLIVMGARGLSSWQGIILGSVSMAVAQRAECPVLIVK